MAIEVGNVFEGRVTGVKPFGAFVALPEGRVGMVHISEVSNEFVQDIAAVLHDGDIVKVQVINIAPDGKIALSIKRLLPPPPRPGGGGGEALQEVRALVVPVRAAPARVVILVQAAAALAAPRVRAAEALPATAHPVYGSPRLPSVPIT